MGKANDAINQILSIKRDVGKARQAFIRAQQYIEQEDISGAARQVIVDKEEIMDILRKGLDALSQYD